MNITLTDDEFKILKEIFYDHGSDCPCTCSEDFQALGEKLGILEPIPEPTEEELKRREEFKNSPYGLLMSKMLVQTNKEMAKFLIDGLKENAFLKNIKTDLPIGTKIKIRFPNNHIVGK